MRNILYNIKINMSNMSNKWDLFYNVLMTMQNTYNLNDLPDRLMHYVLNYELTNPNTDMRLRHSGLIHIINALNVIPGEEPFNLYDRINRPEIILDLYEFGYNPYKLTKDGLALHQTILNLNQWLALLQIGYNLCLSGSNIDLLPNLFQSEKETSKMDITNGLFSLISTLRLIPEDVMISPIKFRHFLDNALTNSQCEKQELSRYINYIESLLHHGPKTSNSSKILLNILNNVLKEYYKQ